MVITVKKQRDWPEYVLDVIAGRTPEQAGEMAGVHADGIRRWLKGKNEPGAHQVVAFARAFHQPVAEALIAAGYIEPKDVIISKVIEVHQSVQDISDDKLVAEIARRLRDRPQEP